MDQTLPWSELSATVRKVAGPALEAVEFLDTFSGGNLPNGRHSVHFGLRFRHPDHTLTGEQVDRSVNAVISACTEAHQAVLRS
ncbi:MAG: hypothetical protein U0794_13585 [Isosphaeraceae bacterium]